MNLNPNVLSNFEYSTFDKMFQNTMNLPITAFMNFIVPDSVKREIRIVSNKEHVLNYLREVRKASIFEIGDKFDLTFDEVDVVLRALEDEKKISIR